MTETPSEEGLHFLKTHQFENIYFPEIKKSFSELVAMSSEDRARFSKKIKNWDSYF